MKKFAYIAASILFFVCLLGSLGVYAAEPYLIAGLGQSKAQPAYGTAANDVAWQQKGFPHSEDLKSTSYHFGIGYNVKPWLAGELTYHDLGTVSQHGEWLYNDDGSRNCSCPCSGDGSAPVKGWTLAGIARYPFGNFSAGIELGTFKWQSAWHEVIHDKSGNVGRYDPVKSSGVGALTGLVLGYKTFDIRYETFHVEPRDGIFNSLTVLRVNYKYVF